MGEVSAFGCRHDCPSTVSEIIANGVCDEFYHIGGEERYHVVVGFYVNQCPTLNRFVPHGDKVKTCAVQDFHLFSEITPCKFLLFPCLALVRFREEKTATDTMPIAALTYVKNSTPLPSTQMFLISIFAPLVYLCKRISIRVRTLEAVSLHKTEYRIVLTRQHILKSVQLLP